MRIAFCGPSGSGKSTLTLELGDIINHSNKNLPEHEIIAFSRPTYAARLMGYANANEVPTDDETQLKFQTQCLIQQIESEKVAGIHYVIDRTTIDNLAYLEFKLPHLKYTSFHKLYETIAIGLCNHDFLFYVPNFSDAIEDNGLRFTIGQKEVEAKFLDIFNRCNIIPHVVESKSLSDRLDEICEVIKLK
jgi:energy-coupling factor transporter ATP-binding protein EcfA2